jgi:hypothetical protein
MFDSRHSSLVSFSVVAAIVLAASPALAQGGPNKTSNVQVVNTAAEPVPTVAQGTTNVEGTVNIGNTPNVNVVGLPAVQIGNDPSAPVPVQDVVRHQTTSALISFAAGEQTKSASPATPVCPGSQHFLIDSVFAAPDWFGKNVSTLTGWSVRVNVFQRFAGGGGISRPILLYGNGPQHVSMQMTGGQTTTGAGGSEIFIQLLGGPAVNSQSFDVQVSGYCGEAFEQ